MSSETATTTAVVDELFRWIRTHATHGTRHPLADAAGAALSAAVSASRPPFALQFVLGAVFRDRKLVPMDVESYERAVVVGAALGRAGIEEIAFDAAPAPAAIAPLGALLGRANVGQVVGLDELKIADVRWRSVPDAFRGGDAEQVDPEVAATVNVTLALADAERLPSGSTQWPWSAGVAIVRRLERALAVQTSGTLRTIELAPGTWTPARRVVSAALHVLLVLRALGSTVSTQRAAAHAVIVIGTCGYGSQGGVALANAAALARTMLVGDDARPPGTLEPHHLRVISLVHGLAGDPAGDRGKLVVMPLVALAYDLDRRRCPPGARFVYSRLDLLALAVADVSYDTSWVRALVNAAGVVPPGAPIALADGRHGIVVGPRQDPWRPEVLVDGRLIIPDEPVRLLSPRDRGAGRS